MERAFTDRAEAGRTLAGLLDAYAQRNDVVVLALPRGGVPVAYEVARTLGVALDVLVVRKLGVPWQPELAMGAIASGGALYVDEALVREIGLPQTAFDRVLASERAELERREQSYRVQHRMPVEIEGRVALVVDDGVATGASMKAAVRALRARRPAKIVAALPVAPPGAAHRLEEDVDEFVCALTPANFYAVGQFYADFSETTDDDVRALLAKTDPRRAGCLAVCLEGAFTLRQQRFRHDQQVKVKPPAKAVVVRGQMRKRDLEAFQRRVISRMNRHDDRHHAS
jgi:putative phosphoribosyl transferase